MSIHNDKHPHRLTPILSLVTCHPWGGVVVPPHGNEFFAKKSDYRAAQACLGRSTKSVLLFTRRAVTRRVGPAVSGQGLAWDRPALCRAGPEQNKDFVYRPAWPLPRSCFPCAGGASLCACVAVAPGSRRTCAPGRLSPPWCRLAAAVMPPCGGCDEGWLSASPIMPTTYTTHWHKPLAITAYRELLWMRAGPTALPHFLTDPACAEQDKTKKGPAASGKPLIKSNSIPYVLVAIYLIRHSVDHCSRGIAVIQGPLYTVYFALTASYQFHGINFPQAVWGHVLRQPKGLCGPFNVPPDGLPCPVLVWPSGPLENPLTARLCP